MREGIMVWKIQGWIKGEHYDVQRQWMDKGGHNDHGTSTICVLVADSLSSGKSNAF